MLGVFSTLLLAFAPSYAAAAICSPGFNWTYNSQGQSPCDIAASLLGVCAPGAGPLPQLPPGYYYVGPTVQSRNECSCSTVYFSMLSACAVCQSRETIPWKMYATNCSTIYVQTFPDPLPAGVRVPNYAYLDVTAGSGAFDPSLAQAAGGAESVAGPSATTTGLGVSPTNMQSPKKKPNSGAIAGGVVGGVALLVIMAIVVVWFVLRRRDSRRQSRFSYASSVKTEPQGYTG